MTTGWRFSYTVRERGRRDGLYPDPDDPGMMSKRFKISGITGSDCSNVWPEVECSRKGPAAGTIQAAGRQKIHLGR